MLQCLDLLHFSSQSPPPAGLATGEGELAAPKRPRPRRQWADEPQTDAARPHRASRSASAGVGEPSGSGPRRLRNRPAGSAGPPPKTPCPPRQAGTSRNETGPVFCPRPLITLFPLGAANLWGLLRVRSRWCGNRGYASLGGSRNRTRPGSTVTMPPRASKSACSSITLNTASACLLAGISTRRTIPR